jgi:hypothetical protein
LRSDFNRCGVIQAIEVNAIKIESPKFTMTSFFIFFFIAEY